MVLGDFRAGTVHFFPYGLTVNTHSLRLRRIRSKILRVRQLSRIVIAQGGTSEDIEPCVIRLNMCLRHHHLQAGERELDRLLVGLQQKTIFDGGMRPAA
jgi:hypothetical protein